MKEYLYSELSGYFQIDESSPSGLVRIRNKAGKKIKGYPVGTKLIRKDGSRAAWTLTFQYKVYLVHRIIWVLKYESIDPELVIDHLDGNPFNNKINNLSLKTVQGNSRNRQQYKCNKTGTTGVKLMNNKGYQYYVVQWYNTDGSRNHKCFSVLKLGASLALKLATDYHNEQMEVLKLQGINYTERHGK